MSNWQDSSVPDASLDASELEFRKNARAQPDVIAPVPSGVAATDTAGLQDAINDTPAGGYCLIPGNKSDKTVPYLLNKPLSITKHIQLEGSSLVETFTPLGDGGGIGNPTNPGLAGAVLQQVTAATDVIQATGAAISVHIANLGLTWDSSIWDTNTGHGFNAFPTRTKGTGHEQGLSGFSLRNVVVFRVDGNHYGFRFRNMILGRLDHLRVYGGGGFLFDSDSDAGFYGNLLCTDTYVEMWNSGTADGYQLCAVTDDRVNLIEFHRIQANGGGPGTGKLFNANGGAGKPSRIALYGHDFEGSQGVDFGGVNSGVVVYAKGGLISGSTPAAFDGELGYQKFTGAGTYTFVVPEGVYRIRVRAVGGGGGGGGGGTNAAAAANTGGGGGGAGMVAETTLTVSPGQSKAIVIGGGGIAGTAGTAGGNAGGAGGNGVLTSFDGNTFKAQPGGGGAGGPASATSVPGGGLFGNSGTISTAYVPGFGGTAPNGNGTPAAPMPPGVVGGGGGGASNTTNGGLGGGAATGTYVGAWMSGGTAHGSASATGGDGTTATYPGCGGGGGGGAPSGGAGGAGGAGADGMVEIWW